MKELDVFIEGETMDLCIPTIEFARESDWYSWFNSNHITKYLNGQGFFPNTPDGQESFFETEKRNRLILIVSNKQKYIGVVSISKIDLINKTGEFSLVINGLKDIRMALSIALEAAARITEYAFTNLGLNRITSLQHIDLWRWRRRMELIGYKVEGLHEGGFIKGHESGDTISLSYAYDNFKKIAKNRGGGLWDSLEKMELRHKKLPQNTFTDSLLKLYDIERKTYYKKIFSL